MTFIIKHMFTQDLTSVGLREIYRPHGPGGLVDTGDLAGGGVGVCGEGEVPWAERGLSAPKQASWWRPRTGGPLVWGPPSPGETLAPLADSRATLERGTILGFPWWPRG